MRLSGIGLAALFSVHAFAGNAGATPLASLPGIASIAVWEDTKQLATDPLDQRVFAISDAALATRLAVLDAANNDFASSVGEFYDVFLSDSDGTPDAMGEYLTIEVIYDTPGSNGGNINRIDLNFSSGPTQFADSVASFVTAGPGVAGSVGNAVDADIDTTTLLGSTFGTSGRLRLTVGFSATAVPEPAVTSLLALGLGLAVAKLGRRRSARL